MPCKKKGHKLHILSELLEQLLIKPFLLSLLVISVNHLRSPLSLFSLLSCSLFPVGQLASERLISHCN